MPRAPDHHPDHDHGHTPVLADPVLRLLAPRPGDVAVDCTAGRGGHTVRLAEAVAGGATGRVVAFDLDAESLALTSARLRPLGVPFDVVHDSFLHAPERLVGMGLAADVVLADLGVSSSQLDDPRRGFSFRRDGPLDMRLDPSGTVPGPTAAELVATLPEADLADLIRTCGEEPLAGKIARNLARRRAAEPIETTAELAQLVVEAYGPRARTSRMHPATRTFMALRIAVNGELEAVKSLLESIARAAADPSDRGWLRRGARVAIIGFHSLEDRLVKRAFADLVRHELATALTTKPVRAGSGEVEANVRSRSARLRAVRIDGPAEV